MLTTFDALQNLDDATFHRLCDELLPRVFSRYYPLTPHGISPAGTSIKGQPDSFVGNTIQTATVALCYSTQRQRWWTKLRDDVVAAKRACPAVQEVVWATSRETERDSHKTQDWLSTVEADCAPAVLTIFSGRRLAHLLDSWHQDLRLAHLGIPHSRLDYESFVGTCQRRSERAVQELQIANRYDPRRYATRRADATLFELWQACGLGTGTRVRPRLIPVVAAAGVGKTSLLCRFTESFSPRLPLLFITARDLSWAAEDALVRSVIQAVEGVLEPEVRSGEEQSIVRLLHRRWPLTVVVDGVDETHQPEQVRRALRFWLSSSLATESTLILSSRPQFWALAGDDSWGLWLPNEAVHSQQQDSSHRLVEKSRGFALPQAFDAAELEDAWIKAGRTAGELAALGPDVRAELAHPFTLRAFVDLESPPSPEDGPTTRALILELWINQRLRAEESRAEFLTWAVYRKALTAVARYLEGPMAWLDLERAAAEARYDRLRPPGPLIERLLAGGLIEVDSSRTRIRFSHEAIADFFLGELDATRALNFPDRAADEMLGPCYSAVALRLEVLGRHIREQASPSAFLARLIEQDSSRAILVMRGSPEVFHPEVRRRAVTSLASEIAGRLRARAAHAVELLARFRCEEAREALVDRLHPAAKCPDYLKVIGSIAVARAGAVEAIDVTYDSPLFGWSDSYYFADVIHVLRSSSGEFRNALAQWAERDLVLEPGSREYVRSVCVLAYLADERLVDHLSRRFEANGELDGYENHALIAIGTEAAARLFERAANAAASKITTLGWADGGSARSEVFHSISPLTADLRYLLTQPFISLVRRWLELRDDANEDTAAKQLKRMAVSLAASSRTKELLKPYLLAKDSPREHLPYEPVLEWLDPRDWYRWWTDSDLQGRRCLLKSLPGVITPAVETALIEALNDREVAWRAARYLGSGGGWRAKSALRDFLETVGQTKFEEFSREEAARTLGRLRDGEAVSVLEGLARMPGELSRAAVTSLALIGTADSEEALIRLLPHVPAKLVAGALVIHGSAKAVSRAIAVSAEPDRGAKWLIRSVTEALWGRGWRRGEYFHQIDDSFGTHLKSSKLHFESQEGWEYLRLLERIDGESIRSVLRDLAEHAGTAEDEILRESDGLRLSRMAYDQLYDRGDTWALPQLVGEVIAEDRPHGRFMAERLLHYRREDVAAVIRRTHRGSISEWQRAELDRLLGFFGSDEDVEWLREEVRSLNDAVASAADEAFLRLKDPLRLPDKWSGLRYNG